MRGYKKIKLNITPSKKYNSHYLITIVYLRVFKFFFAGNKAIPMSVTHSKIYSFGLEIEQIF